MRVSTGNCSAIGMSSRIGGSEPSAAMRSTNQPWTQFASPALAASLGERQRVFVELVEVGLRGPLVAILDVARLEAVEDAGVASVVEDALVERLDVDGAAAGGIANGEPVDVAAQLAWLRSRCP